MGASKFAVGVIFSSYSLVGFISSPFIGLLVSIGLKLCLLCENTMKTLGKVALARLSL